MTKKTENPAPEEQKPNFDTEFENITPWNGQNDNGRDVRMKWMRNFERIKRNFSSIGSYIGSIIGSKLEGLDLKFLHRDREDDTNFVIRFLSGIVVKKLLLADHLQSTNFKSGLLGSGFVVKKDADGRAYIETDDLVVRRRALFAVLEILKERYVAGDFIQGPGGGQCKKVVEYDTFYRCYLLADDGEKAVENTFDVDDQVRCQEFNIKPGVHQNVSNQYYWRRCIAVGDDYIDLSKTDCDKGSMPPKAGDDMATMGNRTNPDRQNVSVLGVYGKDAPYYKQYIGVNSYDLTGKEKTVVSPHGNKFTGKFYFTSGEEAEAAFNEMKRVYEENLSYVKALENELNAVKNQLDGNITTWFLDPVPTLHNEPYISWKDNAERDMHLKDLYFDKTGQIYRFEKKSGAYCWVIVEDQQLSKALQDAAKAQDTADGKRRVFVRQPKFEEVYDEGDLWVNATVGKFEDDLLRCRTHKDKNVSFSIEHWELATDYASKKAVNALFQATDEKIEGIVQSFNKLKGTVTELETRVTQTESDITLQAKKITSTANTVSSHTTRINQNAEAIKLKAEKSVVDTLSGKVSDQQTAIEQNANSIKLKASQSEVDTLSGKVKENSSAIKLMPDTISLKVKEEMSNAKLGIRNLIRNSSLIVIDSSTSSYNHIKLKPTVPFKANTAYILSVENVEIATGSHVDKLDISIYNVDSYSSYFNGSLIVKAGKQTIKFETPSNLTDTDNVVLRVYSGASGSSENRSVKIYSLMLVEGMLAGEWSPAPEDLENTNPNLVMDSAFLFEDINTIKEYTLARAWKALEGSLITISFDYDYWSVTTGPSGSQRIGLEAKIKTTNGIESIGAWINFNNSDRPILKDGRFSVTATVPKYITDYKYDKITAHIDLPGGSGYVKIKNIKVEIGAKATAWCPALEDSFASSEQLLDTGIDIKNKKITVTANQFFVQSNTGDPLALFSAEDGIHFNKDVYCTYIKATQGTVGGFNITENKLTGGTGNKRIDIGVDGITIYNADGYFYAGASYCGINDGFFDLKGEASITNFKLFTVHTKGDMLHTDPVYQYRYNNPIVNCIFVDGYPNGVLGGNIIEIDMVCRRKIGYMLFTGIKADCGLKCILKGLGQWIDCRGGWHNNPDYQLGDNHFRMWIYDGLYWHEGNLFN